MSLTVSKEFGVNPSVEMCTICGKESRLIAVKEETVKEMLSEYDKVNYMEHSLFEHYFGTFLPKQ